MVLRPSRVVLTEDAFVAREFGGVGLTGPPIVPCSHLVYERG